MHRSNELFWQYVKRKYNEYFNDEILEVGSYNINGSIKDTFGSDSKKYIGVDWREGPNVDVVSLAHEMKFDHQFNAVLSASMLEHDPYWKDSITNMVNILKQDGILVLTWGAALNQEHCLNEAPDGDFHCLKVEQVTKLLATVESHITVLIEYRTSQVDFLCFTLSKDILSIVEIKAEVNPCPDTSEMKSSIFSWSDLKL